MHERFSDRARHAMALANHEASNMGHDFLAPAHLMLGLIAEGRCVATEALRLLDVDLDRVRDEVASQLKPGNAGPTVARRAHTQALKDAIAHAIKEARDHNDRYVGTEHLVIGMLANGENIPSKVLRGMGVDIESLREKALGLLRASKEDDHDLVHSRHGDFEWAHQAELAKAFRSAKFWHTMILAVDEANRMGAGEVEPEHLLIALLRDRESGVSAILGDKGVTPDSIREKLSARE